MVKKIKLPNGLRIVFVPQPKSLTATVLVLVEAGSEYETKKINGLSHFLEHLMFKGTTKRPEPGTIARELDSLGAEYNAFTGQEYTGYWAKSQSHKLPAILELVSDLYLNPIFNAAEIEKERGVIIEEINMYEDTPMRRVQETFSSLMYGDQPAGWDIAGKKEVIRKLSREQFMQYREKHYVAPATLVVVAGDFDHKRVLKDIQAGYGRLPKRPRNHKSPPRGVQTKPRSAVKFKASDQSHLVLGVPAFDIFDSRRHALEVLADVLGGGMSSRLFRRVREELGAAYYVRAGVDLFTDHGLFAVSAGVDHQKIEIVLAAVLAELKLLSRERVGPTELKKAKDHMIGNMILGLESSDELASFYGGQEILTRKLVAPKALIKKVEAVTADEIRKLAKALFLTGKLNLAIIGPYKKPESFKKILKL